MSNPFTISELAAMGIEIRIIPTYGIYRADQTHDEDYIHLICDWGVYNWNARGKTLEDALTIMWLNKGEKNFTELKQTGGILYENWATWEKTK